MKQPKYLVIVVVFALLLGASFGAGQAAAENQPVIRAGNPLGDKANAGSTFTYQGYLKFGGVPANGAYDFRFSLATTASKDEDALEEDAKILPSPITKENLQVTDGLFTVELNFGHAVFDGTEYYLQIEVRPGASTGAFTVLSPRQPIRASIYALSLVPGAEIYGVIDGSEILRVENFGTGDALYAHTYSTSASALFGWADRGTASGVYGQSDSSTGYGVVGENTATTGNAFGVYGASNASGGVGVYGDAKTFGLVGRTSVISGEVYGVQGLTSSTSGTAVLGWADTTTGTTYGVRGRSSSSSGYGGYFYNTSSGTGLFANSSSGKDLVLGGSFGSVYSSSGDDGAMGLLSYDNIEVHLDENNNDNTGSGTFFSIFDGGNTARWWVYEDGSHTAKGTNTGLVLTELFGWREMYAIESTEVWFEDFGSASLVDGAVTVAIEPVFAQTVNLKEDYHVYLTPLGDCSLYVSEKTTEGFSVKAIGGATCSIDFDYRIVARRLGYEDTRLKSISLDSKGLPQPYSAPNTPGVEIQPEDTTPIIESEAP